MMGGAEHDKNIVDVPNNDDAVLLDYIKRRLKDHRRDAVISLRVMNRTRLLWDLMSIDAKRELKFAFENMILQYYKKTVVKQTVDNDNRMVVNIVINNSPKNEVKIDNKIMVSLDAVKKHIIELHKMVVELYKRVQELSAMIKPGVYSELHDRVNHVLWKSVALRKAIEGLEN